MGLLSPTRKPTIPAAISRLPALCAAALLLFPPAATSAEPGVGDDDTRLRVVTTLPVLAGLIAEIGGDRIDVVSLLRAGDDVHVFEPLPVDMKALRGADVIYQIGLDLEPWLDPMIRSSGTGATRIRLSDGIDRIPAGGHHGHAGHRHAYGSDDPHIWMDPVRVTFMAISIAETLAEADPGGAGTYLDRAEAVVADINRTHRRVSALLDDIPEEHRKLVTPHDNYRYFAERYGFAIAGTIAGRASTDHFDPSARHIKALVDAIRAAGLPAVFSVDGENNPMLERIAERSGCTVAGPLYCTTLKPGASYAETLLHNATVLRDALRPRPL